jgi:hypothetical protein
MKRSKQLPAIDRYAKTAAMLAGAGGVRPSFDWSGLAGALIPIVGGAR